MRIVRATEVQELHFVDGIRTRAMGEDADRLAGPDAFEQACAGAVREISHRSCGSETRESVSAPITSARLASPDLM